MAAKKGTRFTTTETADGRLGFWTKPDMSKVTSTFTYIVTVDTAYRSDKISNVVYGTVHYDWIILTFNDITDPFRELKPGTVLTIPSLATIGNFL